MTPRLALCAALLASASVALCPFVALHRAQAQEVKEQWNIDSPPPDDVATDKSQPGASGTAAGAASVAAKAGGTNEHGFSVVKNPYTDKTDAIAQGKELFVTMACSGCHGAGGGGGMCPPVVNDTWVYGSDDTTLFNLIKLGSAAFQAKGYARVGHEKVVGDMPPFAGVVTDDQEWKLIAYVRSRYAGDAAQRNW
ncbi:MAG: c-type cytochrome [Dokdonella sp.]